ncbi:hypothetical protein HUG15_21735 [Salicibibacter cibarius]|uniref:Uncharacterized protein n=1 Tax=Salicibibacter cibarius TaxID=2743000 RepID=A0A7T6Z6P4_9BACI|nr:hypothetical protein [Salicibibacter cibarius]QQK77941.1 hypothetical protein HUG15_21735 [Salicibibacter cibarius]
MSIRFIKQMFDEECVDNRSVSGDDRLATVIIGYGYIRKRELIAYDDAGSPRQLQVS